MDKSVIAVLSGASALVMVGGAQASAVVGGGGDANGLERARSFAELLDPIPDASRLLQAEDKRTSEIDSKPVEMAQNYHHHHHHHHHYRYRHHHHHHYGYHHHYHHHHHHYQMMMLPLPRSSG